MVRDVNLNAGNQLSKLLRAELDLTEIIVEEAVDAALLEALKLCLKFLVDIFLLLINQGLS